MNVLYTVNGYGGCTQIYTIIYYIRVVLMTILQTWTLATRRARLTGVGYILLLCYVLAYCYYYIIIVYAVLLTAQIGGSDAYKLSRPQSGFAIAV